MDLLSQLLLSLHPQQVHLSFLLLCFAIFVEQIVVKVSMMFVVIVMMLKMMRVRMLLFEKMLQVLRLTLKSRDFVAIIVFET